MNQFVYSLLRLFGWEPKVEGPEKVEPQEYLGPPTCPCCHKKKVPVYDAER